MLESRAWGVCCVPGDPTLYFCLRFDSRFVPMLGSHARHACCFQHLSSSALRTFTCMRTRCRQRSHSSMYKDFLYRGSAASIAPRQTSAVNTNAISYPQILVDQRASKCSWYISVDPCGFFRTLSHEAQLTSLCRKWICATDAAMHALD